MNIMLGNLTIEEMQTRSGVTFPQKLVDYLKDRHQPNASNIQKGKWHCFDLPFVLVCGDMDTAKEIYKHLAPFSSDFKEAMQISIETKV